MNDDLSPRLTAMRDALVAEVDATPPVRRRRPSRGTVAAVVAAFLVGGGLTGGLTAAALPGADPDAVLQAELAAYSKSMVEEANYGVVLGTPSATAGHDRSELRLGARPAGADRVSVAWACTTPGTVTVRIGGTAIEGLDACSPGDAGSVPGGGTHWALQGIPIDGDDATTVTVVGSAGAHYVVWATYARGAEVAEPSPQQDAETADGTITLAEYTTAFKPPARMPGAGRAADAERAVDLVRRRDVGSVCQTGSTGPWYLYSTPSEGSEVFDTQCYPREFSDVDALWQAEHPQPENSPVQP